MAHNHRWKYPEHEVLNTKEVRFGDVSAWSTATTGAKRPRDVKMPVHKFTPVDTDKLVPIIMPEIVAAPSGITAPVHTPEQKQAGADPMEVVDISNRLNAILMRGTTLYRQP